MLPASTFPTRRDGNSTPDWFSQDHRAPTPPLQLLVRELFSWASSESLIWPLLLVQESMADWWRLPSSTQPTLMRGKLYFSGRSHPLLSPLVRQWFHARRSKSRRMKPGHGRHTGTLPRHSKHSKSKWVTEPEKYLPFWVHISAAQAPPGSLSWHQHNLQVETLGPNPSAILDS